MKRLLLILLLLLGLPVMTVAAQDKSTNTLFIYVELGSDASAPHHADEILFALDDFFKVSLFDVIFVTDTEGLAERVPIFGNHDDYPDLFLPDSPVLSLFIKSFEDADQVLMSPYTGYLSHPLPVRALDWSMTFMVGEDYATEIKDVASALAGLGGYVTRRYEDAIPFFDYVLANDTVIEQGVLIDVGLSAYKAACLFQLGRVGDAIDAYQQSIGYDAPRDGRAEREYTVNPAINLAWIYMTIEQADSALEVLRDYEDVLSLPFGTLDPSTLPIELARINLYADLGESDTALDRFAELIATLEADLDNFTTDEHARLYAERGRLQMDLGDRVAALDDLDYAIRINPTYPKVYFFRAQVYDAQSDPDAARVDYQTFIRLTDGYYNYYEENLSEYLKEAQAALGE